MQYLKRWYPKVYSMSWTPHNLHLTNTPPYATIRSVK